jgi:outer membrane protein assembly factor BamB
MKKIVHLTILIAFLTALTPPNAQAGSGSEYWPRWRGPDGNGTAPNANPPVQWSESQNIKWKVQFPGRGLSSPIIWADKIFFQTAVATDEKPPEKTEKPAKKPRWGSNPPEAVYKFDLVCMDRKTGKVLWQKTVRKEFPHEGHHPDHGFASFSPITDGKLIWANFGSRGLHCYDIDGNFKWSAEMTKMKTRNSFGEGSSPAIAGDAVIVVADQEGDSYIFAFNKNTGKQIWKKKRDERTSWATPVPVEVNGKMQVVASSTNFIRSYDVKTGDVVWQCAGQTANTIPTPVLGFGNIYCTSGFRGSALMAIELGRTGDLTGTDAIKWQVNEATPYVPSPLLYGDKLYVCSSNKGIISCYQAKTGKPNFVKQKLDEIRGIYASPVAAAGRVYFAGRNGTCYVIKCSDKFEVLAVNKLDEKFNASPAIVGGELFLKGEKYLYCIAEPTKEK